MRHSLLALAAVAAALSTSPLQAAPAGSPDGLRAALHSVAITENAQFMWQGSRYCWYDGGWHGEGWYRCGFAWRRGLGWGGGLGWNNWERGERRMGREGFERRMGREGFERREFREGRGEAGVRERMGNRQMRSGTTGAGMSGQGAQGGQGGQMGGAGEPSRGMPR